MFNIWITKSIEVLFDFFSHILLEKTNTKKNLKKPKLSQRETEKIIKLLISGKLKYSN